MILVSKSIQHAYSGSLLLFTLILISLNIQAQAGNPFDISPRLKDTFAGEAAAVQQDSPQQVKKVNPFDIIAAPDENGLKRQPRAVTSQPAPSKNNSAVFRFVLVVFILSMLAFLLTILRTIAAKSFSAFLNSNMLNQLYREQEGRGISPFLLLYAMFLINLGIFLFLTAGAFNIDLSANQFFALLLCLLASFGLFVGKHILLGLVSFIFPVQKEISRYHFLIIIYGIVIGFLLVPFNLLLAFGPQGWLRMTVYTALIVIGLIYVYRYIRGMAIASKFLVFHKFHFLLYICTIEITPVIIILKLAQSGI